MLKRKDKTMTNSNIEFVSYTGTYPNLCCGVLTVNVNGKKYEFGGYNRVPLMNKGDDYYPEMLPKFWSTGGYCRLDENLDGYAHRCPWKISTLVDEDDYPKEIWECLNDILDVFNKNAPWGCCGGCL